MTVQRVPQRGDVVMFLNEKLTEVPATVTSANGQVVDLRVHDPRAAYQALAVTQDKTHATASTWDFDTCSGLQLATSGTQPIAAATSGTSHAPSGQFILSSGQSAYTLTNNFITTTSIVLIVKQTAEGSSRTLLSVVPASGSVVVTMSGTVGADTTFGYAVLNPAP